MKLRKGGRKIRGASEYRRLAHFAGIATRRPPAPQLQRVIASLAWKRASEALRVTILNGGTVDDALASIYVRAIADAAESMAPALKAEAASADQHVEHKQRPTRQVEDGAEDRAGTNRQGRSASQV